MIGSDDVINIYCDESCHLENDNSDIMVLGCISCPINSVRWVNKEIRNIKEKYNINRNAETKWTKVSMNKIEFYKKLIDLFFETDCLNFRAVIAKDKDNLNHDAFNQDHDTWYYKMYYLLLRNVVNIGNTYRIYADIKDTHGADKIEFLKEILNHALYDFYDETIEHIQLIRSDEVEILQLTDLIMGAISYINRNYDTSKAKLELVNHLKLRSGFDLKHKTSKDYNKFNLFVWTPRR